MAVLLGLPAQAEGSGDRPSALTGSIRTDTRARVRSRVDGQERAHELDLAHGAVGAALGSHLPRRPGRASEISAHSDRLVIPFSGSSNTRRERAASRRPEVERPSSTPGIRAAGRRPSRALAAADKSHWLHENNDRSAIFLSVTEIHDSKMRNAWARARVGDRPATGAAGWGGSAWRGAAIGAGNL